MKNHAVSFPEEAIIDFLKHFGKGANSKDYEFIAALVIRRFCEKQWSMPCLVGYHLKPKYSAALPTQGDVSLAQLEDIFRNGIDENDPEDFVITRVKNGTPQGMPFQVKRFGLGREKKDTDELIAYLNTFPEKYQKMDISLAIFFDGIDIEPPKLRAAIDMSKFPFNRIMLVWQAEKKICLGDIYPDYGMEEYDLKEFVG